jgi:hypothetical protein
MGTSLTGSEEELTPTGSGARRSNVAAPETALSTLTSREAKPTRRVAAGVGPHGFEKC